MPDRRLELAALLKCPTCEGVPFHLYRRQNAKADGAPLPTFEPVLWPTDPSITPPTDPSRLVCPIDGTALRRVAA